MSAGGNRMPFGGLLIDREATVGFAFDGRRYEGFRGDTIASALAANGVWLLSRSFKYHRPRGIASMTGQDANGLVQLKGEPNVQAERREIEEGLAVSPQNVVGSLARDRGARIERFSRFLPVGFYYRTFFRPRGIWQGFWERRVRRAAGLGQVDLDARPGYFDKAYAFADVAVVGAGPAGLSAALAAAGQGARVLLVEQEPYLGGALGYARLGPHDESAELRRAELAASVEAESGIEVMTGAVCNGWFADNWLPVIRGDRLWKLRAQAVVLATGAMEQPAQFRNNDLPGVMLGSAAQRLIRLYGVRPGRRAVVLTGGDEGYLVALDLLDAGLRVAAVVDLRPDPGASEAVEAVRAQEIEIHAGCCVWQALGKRHVTGVELKRLGAAGPEGEVLARLDCDLLTVSAGFMPAYQLALHARAKLEEDGAGGGFRITGLPDGIGLAGSVAGHWPIEDVLADGRRAGWLAAKAAGFAKGRAPRAPAPMPAAHHAWPIAPHPGGRDFVDLDEDLQVKDIRNAVADGYAELELVKRFSTVGMGPSQGRHSALATARLVAEATGRSLTETGVTTARPPLGPERLGVLAGRHFEPEWRTAMHHRHLEAGAQMMTAGLWWRPAFYGPPEERAAAIAREALAVRGNAGLIDVSTLGGIEIRGPDAAEFMNRVYTFAYKKQPVGRARYVLMTNEAGTIVDDGVACRLAEDHFYVTATTGGVDRVYRTMHWWNLQWRLEVDIANVTAAYAGVNLAGPKSREILAPLVEGCALDAEAFPYMGAREATVAGLPARLFRVGFVGELGFEIHVGAGLGEALWDALVAAGAAHDLVPFGVEAQRVLRLEKGHIIIGQDTDAMTTPEEAEMGWAVAGKKPFFIGKRSLELRGRHLSRRKLVGFELPPDAPPPQESDLVLKGETVAGFVTSVARSPALDKTIGLAYADRDDAEVGRTLTILLEDGHRVTAEVAPHPFYDPDNARQAL